MANVTKYQTSRGETRWRVRYRKPDGTQTDKRGFRRKTDAERWAAEHVTVAKATGTYIDPQDGKTHVGTLWEPWIAKKRTRCKPSTIRPLEITWDTHVKPRWADTPISAITRADVQSWVTDLTTRRSATVVLRAHGILAGILDDAADDRTIPANPARRVELPRRTRRKHTYLTASQLFTLAESVTPWRRDIILTLGLCGMRWGELIPLRVRDVDLDRRRIYIGVSAPTIGGVVTPSDDTKGHKERTIMFPTILDGIMRARCEGREEGELLFPWPGHEGEMIRESGASSHDDGWLLTGLRKAGVDTHMTIHDLRHTAASLMVQSGANVKAVQRQLGHASASMTLDVYADLFDDDLDMLSESMGQLLLQQNVGRMWAKQDGGIRS